MQINILTSIMGFIASNIAYILIVVAILYFIFFVWGIINAKKTGETFHFRLKNLIAFILILGFAIYCLVTGQDIKTFIH